MTLAPINDALQHGPRPLPSFLRMLRREHGGDPAMLAAVLAGVRLFQRVPRRPPVPPVPEIARVGRAVLRDYGGAGRPLLVVPSLINPPTILDLDADRSMLRWLAGQGIRTLLLDWGTPGGGEALNVGGHVTDLLLPLMAALPEPPVLAGYCLGGTMALAAAALRPTAGVALIAAPWHFAAYPDDARAGLAELWRASRPMADALGLLPMEVLQLAFWQLDPQRTLAKFAGLPRLDAAGLDGFVTLEDWANGGVPLVGAAAREIMEDFFGTDVTGAGGWRVDGTPVRPDAIAAPAIQFLSTTDRLVPAASAPAIGERHHTPAGHVGMVVGRSAPAGLWQPLRDWMRALA